MVNPLNVKSADAIVEAGVENFRMRMSVNMPIAPMRR